MPETHTDTHTHTNSLEVLVSALSLPLQPQVQGVVSEPLVVSAHIKGDRQGVLRVYTTACRVQCSFAERDAMSVRTQITETEYAL